MKTPLRLSPIHNALQSIQGTWRDINEMPSLMTVSRQSAIPVGIADLSCLTRFGVKGANAAEWLSQQGFPVPEQYNTWRSLSEGGLIARLGMTEFLIEDSLNSSIAPQLAEACQSPPAKVYPVLRQDLALGLVGASLNELLRQTCSFNFQALNLNGSLPDGKAECPVVLTSMIGVAVTVIPTEQNGQPFYRIWCDSTFGHYFWTTLMEIAIELGGGAIGVEQIFGSQ